MDVAAALQAQHIDMIWQHKCDRGLDGVPACVGGLDHHVGCIVDLVGIVATASHQGIGIRATVQSVIASVTCQQVAAAQSVQLIAAATPVQRIGRIGPKDPLCKVFRYLLLDQRCIPDRSIGETDLLNHAVSARVEVAFQEDLVRGSQDAQFQPGKSLVLPVPYTPGHYVRWQDTRLELDGAMDAKRAVRDSLDNILSTPSAEGDNVRSLQILQRVIARTAVERIDATVAAAQDVVPIATQQGVVAVLSFQRVIASSTQQHVAVDSAIQAIVARATREAISAA